MKQSSSQTVCKKLSTLKKRCPWMASLIQHCLESRDPRSCEQMRTMLNRLRMHVI